MRTDIETDEYDETFKRLSNDFFLKKSFIRYLNIWYVYTGMRKFAKVWASPGERAQSFLLCVW